jgi:uncharacterized surface protein with fasciclin (FAS1) repeats
MISFLDVYNDFMYLNKLCLFLQIKVPIQRRQLTQTQQNHILTDVQQHQHRFNVNQPQFRGQFNGRQQQPPFVQQQSQSFAFPPITSNIQNARFQQQAPSQQPPPAFRQNVRQVNLFARFPLLSKLIPFFTQPSIAPAPAPQALRQTQFQRSVNNQIGQPSFNQPPQFIPFQQQQTVNNPFALQDQFNNFRAPVASPLIQQQQLPVRQQANFLPSPQIPFPGQNSFVQQNFQTEPSRLNQIPAPQFNNFQQTQNNFQQPQTNFQQPQSPFLQPTQALPVEQRANIFQDTRTEEQRQRDLQYRQKLIEKQEKYAQKFYQKQQQQVSVLHEDFVRKQQQLQDETQEKLRPQQSQLIQQSYNRHQGVQPTDLSAFEKSVKKYYQVNPTTTTTTTTTPAPFTTANPLLTVVPLKKGKSKSEVKTLNSEDIQQLLQGNRQNLFSQLKQESSKSQKTKSIKSPLGRDELLKQLQNLALTDGGQDLGDKNFTTQDITLANGERVQVIRTSDPELIRKAKSGNAQIIDSTLSASTPPPLSLADLAKSGILPPGADFEVIKQSENGLQQVQKVPQQKKVTFVYLEELDDGSYKVQGVKSNNDKEAKRSGAEVDSILKRIKSGDIKLPPSAKTADKAIEIPTPAPSTVSQRTTQYSTSQSQKTSAPRAGPDPVSVVPLVSSSISTAIPKNHRGSSSFNDLVRSTVAPQTVTPFRQSTRGSVSQTTRGSSSQTTRGSTSQATRGTTAQDVRGSSPVFQYSFTATTPKPEEVDNGRSPYSTLPSFATSERSNFFSVTPRVVRFSSTTEVPDYATAGSINYIQNAETQKFVSETPKFVSSTRGQVATASSASPTFSQSSSSSLFSSPSYSPTFSTTPPSTTAQSTAAPELANILRKAGLFAMAKYLRQSGLDSILNETGPYTIFAPTDKAFKSLLVQLGGPEKAEEKFKNNPRLLSGLLLHHVIPGSFKIDELQDEMTGVSLAGTQLRVNQYQMQDTEWNDVKVTTINGATVQVDNNDLVIPQGVAHAVDRVMFPLPVGDLLQTLQSDRERRFTHFLRAVFASNMADTLQNKGNAHGHEFTVNSNLTMHSLPGIKTYTVFAPTDVAFSHLTQEELNTVLADKDSAQQLVQRHIVAGTLFTSGMRFYQVKDTLAEDKTVTVQKTGGNCAKTMDVIDLKLI